MVAGDRTARADDRSGSDVLHRLRTETAEEHRAVERSLDLLDPALGRARLAEVLGLLHGFWVAAESGLDAWAVRFPGDAGCVAWGRRRRAALFDADLSYVGGTATGDVPYLSGVADTDHALGRLYVLEGSTLGGTFIDRHLASLPQLSGVRIRAFSPYGSETGAMWAAFRRVVRERVAAGGDAEAMIESARETFRALAAWCHPVREPVVPA
jgi:heme oxygenase (biliverdin-IX-beta and delta-forming)